MSPREFAASKSPWGCGARLATASAALLWVAAQTCNAAVICVRPGGGAPCLDTIAAALAAAGAGDTIRVAAGTYVENLTLDKNVVLEGGWNVPLTIRDPQNFVSTIQAAATGDSVVVIIGNAADPALSTPTIDGFTITGGRADLAPGEPGGGLRILDSHAVVRNNTISGNRAEFSGGGVRVENGAPLIENNRIVDNIVVIPVGGGFGGGVQLEQTQATLRGNRIADNRVEGPEFNGGRGGGVHVHGGTVTLIDNQITGNSAYVVVGGGPTPGCGGCFGGGIAIGDIQASTVTVRGGEISDNEAGHQCQGGGGGIFGIKAKIVIEAVRIERNCATAGGGVSLHESEYSVRNSLLALNQGGGDGDAFRALGPTHSGNLINCTLVGDGTGFAIAADSGGVTDLRNNIIMSFQRIAGPGQDFISGMVNDLFDLDSFGSTGNLDTTYTLDPLLDATYHLTAGSPMIDFGFQSFFGHDVDVDGEPRRMIGPSGLYQIDIGADEFTGPGQRLLLPAARPTDADLTVIGPGYPADNPDSNGSNDWIGFAVLGEDFDGDRRDDLTVSAQDWAEDFATVNATGRVFGLVNFGGRRTGTVDLLTEPANLVVVGQPQNQHAGQELAGGDLDGDGNSDLVIGSGVQTDGDPTIVSTVLVVPGGPALTGEMPAGPGAPGGFKLIAQDGPGSALGDRNALAVGDVNGDGRPDLVAGDASADDGATADAGGVFVIFGEPGLSGAHDLAATPADFTLRGPTAGAALGKVALGRLDGDARLDLVARSADAAYGLFGPLPAGQRRLATTPADLVVAGLGGDGIDDRVALVDVTGDGQDDLVTTGTDEFMQPVLWVFAGPFAPGQSLSPADAERTFVVSTSSIASVDLEGDPKPELIVGSASAKTVWVIPPGSIPSVDPYSVASTIIIGEGDGFKNLGWDVAGGDLDGDRRDDLIVSTWQVVDPAIADGGKSDVGKVLVFYSPHPAEVFADGFEADP